MQIADTVVSSGLLTVSGLAWARAGRGGCTRASRPPAEPPPTSARSSGWSGPRGLQSRSGLRGVCYIYLSLHSVYCILLLPSGPVVNVVELELLQLVQARSWSSLWLLLSTFSLMWSSTALPQSAVSTWYTTEATPDSSLISQDKLT